MLSQGSSAVAEKCAAPFLSELFQASKPDAHKVATKTKRDLTEDMRAQGYTVTGGT